MKRILRYIVLAGMSFSLAACAEEVADQTPCWGAVEAFDDFPIKKFEPQMIKRTLVVDANQDAKDKNLTNLCFALVDYNGVPVGKDKAALYVNGVETDDNTIDVAASDTEIEVGILLNKSFAQSEKMTCNWRLKVIKNPGYERINEFEADQLKQFENVLDDVQLNIKIQVLHKANSAAVTFYTILLVFACVVAAWYMILRPICISRFGLSQIVVTGTNYYKSIKVKRFRKVICTNDRKNKQGFWSKVIFGPICYVYNEYWENDLVILPASGKTARVEASKSYTFTPSKTFKIGTEYTMMKANGDSAKIRVM